MAHRNAPLTPNGRRRLVALVEEKSHFMDSVDRALPLHGENRSRRQEIIDSALRCRRS
jgi:hypothetical protein